MDPIATALIAVVVVVYMLYRQFVQRPVTGRDIILPMLGGAYIGDRFLNGAGATGIVVVLGVAAFGVATGLVSGFVVRVWRDAATGTVYQRGGWSYLAILLSLLAVRLVLRIIFSATGTMDATVLNDAFIAMAIGNYAGRAITVGLRALALVGWDLEALPKSASRRPGRVRSW
jgi:membrane protein CcdC involved in cytochrome C biogenesis